MRGSRIITMQRQARELGRLRTGWTDFSGDRPRPVKSETWVVTSHAAHYVEAAAQLWGGKPERWKPLGNQPEQWRVITQARSIDAMLPPGDPVSQANELWNKGGCARRCDGVTESLSDRPCLCLAEFGENWFEQKKGTVCSATTRLNVMLPELPDLGLYRVESHSYYAANEIAGQVDMLLSATGGKAIVPVSLRIEPRQRVANGQTKKFPVICVEVRGMTARQALAGQVPQIAVESGQQGGGPAAIEAAKPAAPAPNYAELARFSRSADGVREIWKTAQAAGHMTDTLNAELKDLAAQFSAEAAAPEPAAPAVAEPEDEVIELEPVEDDDPTEVWSQIVSAAGRHGWNSDRLESEFAAHYGGVMPGSAEVDDLRKFLAWVKSPAAAQS